MNPPVDWIAHRPFFVTQTLRSLARDGRTVIASVHQPSSEVFELFDSLYLLSGGKTVYFGKASEAWQFFQQAGFPCPPFRNPSDHFLRCINSDFDKVKATLKGSMKLRAVKSDDPLEKITTTKATQILLDYYRSSEYYQAAQSRVQEISQFRGTILDSGGSQASFLMQAFTLTKRSFTNMSRDVGYYWLRLVIYILLTFCIGTIYFRVGTSYGSILARGACASFVFGFVTFMSIGGFPSFVEDMKVFQRERMNGHYGVVAFVVGNTLSGMPYLLLISIISGTICYYMVGLHPGFAHYVFFTAGLYASVTVVESLMMAIASVVPNFLMGIIIGAGIQAQYQNDLLGLEFDNQFPFMPKISGEYVVTQVFQIDVKRSKWWDLSVLFSMIIIYRIIFFVMIKISEDVTPWIRGCIARRTLKKKLNVPPTRPGSTPLVNSTPSLARLNSSPSLNNFLHQPDQQ